MSKGSVIVCYLHSQTVAAYWLCCVSLMTATLLQRLPLEHISCPTCCLKHKRLSVVVVRHLLSLRSHSFLWTMLLLSYQQPAGVANKVYYQCCFAMLLCYCMVGLLLYADWILDSAPWGFFKLDLIVNDCCPWVCERCAASLPNKEYKYY